MIGIIVACVTGGLFTVKANLILVNGWLKLCITIEAGVPAYEFPLWKKHDTRNTLENLNKGKMIEKKREVFAYL